MYGEAPAPTAGDLAAYSLLDLGWVLLLGCLLTRDETFRWNLPGTRPQWFAEGGWGVGLFFVCIGANELFEDLARTIGLRAAPTPWEQWLSDPDTLLAFRITGPLSALSEELLFRVYLQTRLTLIARGWSLVSVPITAWLFAWTHDYAPAETAELFGSALVLGIAYQVSRRVPRLVIAHSVALVFRPI
jgi:membrane protease YdiL (CAAX protease family)